MANAASEKQQLQRPLPPSSAQFSSTLPMIMDALERDLIDPHLGWLEPLGLEHPDFAEALREARERVRVVAG